MGLFERIICSAFGHKEKGKIKVTDENYRSYPTLICARCGQKVNPIFAKLNRPIVWDGRLINFIRLENKKWGNKNDN